LQPYIEAYLDIETTGLSPLFNEITVIGIHLCNGEDTKFVQLVGKRVTPDGILEALARVILFIPTMGSHLTCLSSILGSELIWLSCLNTMT